MAGPEWGRLRWRRYTVDAAVRGDGLELEPSVVEALDAFGEVVESAAAEVRFLMRPGELLLMDNRRALHARTALGGDPRTADRLMIRSWVTKATPRPEGDRRDPRRRGETRQGTFGEEGVSLRTPGLQGDGQL